MSSDPRLIKIEDYMNSDQRSICSSNASYMIVEGVAGSRKTDTMIRLGLRRHLREKKNILFLTQVGSVTDEICSRVGQYLRTPLYRQGMSNHYLTVVNDKTVEVANFDAWIHRQLQDQEWKFLTSMGSYHTMKAKALLELDNFRGFCLKNGQYADEILVDECQDFEPLKAQLIVSLLQKQPHVRAVFCGDYLQTIFEKSLEDNLHPISIFATLPSCQRCYLTKCFRCPAGHVAFCNKILENAIQTYQCQPLQAINKDIAHKPFLFTHGSTTKKYEVHLLVSQLCQMMESLMRLDPSLKLSDFCFIMRKSNNQPVFDMLRVALEKMNVNSVVHFTTQYDGYRNSIQWNHAVGKSCLISIHGDKGKGHKVVFFLGLTQKSIPDECAMHKKEELLYHSLLNVALTRSTKYLFVGFHYAQPSIYLTQMSDTLDNYVYTSWGRPDHDLYQALSQCNRFPSPDFVKSYRQKPLQIPTLNMMSVVEISRRYERPEDIFGFCPKVETMKFGTRVRLTLSDDVYPIISKMCELMVMRQLHPTAFLKDLEWFPTRVFFTDDERLLTWSHDYSLSKWIHTNMYDQQIELIKTTHRTLLDNDPSLKKIVDELKHVHLLPTCFRSSRFLQHVQAFQQQQETMVSWWHLSLLFYGLQQHSPMRYLDMNPPFHHFQNLFQNVKSFLSHLSGDVLFRPCHDMLANVSEEQDLLALGFEKGLDEHYFENGYYYGILGTSGIMDTSCLYDLKASPVDFSMEWFIQTCLHANLPIKRRSPEKLAVVNFLTGKLYRWNNTFQNPKKLLKRLMKTFPDPLSDNLYRTHYHRFKQLTLM